MLELLLFIAAGIIAGVAFGLVPGLHPNMVVLALPLLVAASIEPLHLVAFMAALGISNVMSDFLPSMLLGAPDDGAMAVLPAHRLLLSGHGYSAVKLAVIGGFSSVVLAVALLPLLALVVPAIWTAVRPFIYLLLIGFSAFMILGEKKRLVAAAVFLSAGMIGMMLDTLPVNGTLVLFPVLAGFFGASVLLLQLRRGTRVPLQRAGEIYVARSTLTRATASGTLAGVASGFLPGIGSSELSALASVDKNEKAFLVTFGALAVSNALLSLISLWLIGRARSGIAVVIEHIAAVGVAEVVVMAAAALIAAAVTTVVVLSMARRFVSLLQKVSYVRVSAAVLAMIILMTLAFTGIYGLLVLATCTALGVAVNLAGVRRGLMMGVLILPTALFYAPF